MSQQTDELLLRHTVEQEDKEALAMQRAQELAAKDAARARLRALDDLSRHPGYKILLESLNKEAQIELMKMALGETPTAVTRASANYYTLTMATGYVANEVARLTKLLQT